MTVEKELVMQALREQEPRALSLGELCDRIGVAKGERDDVVDVLDSLVELGLVKELPGHRFRALEQDQPRTAGFTRGPAAAALPHDVTQAERGRLTMHPRGFGFVATESSGPDVFIPPDSVAGALHADYVAVRAHPTPKGREGRIVEVIGRGLSRVTGTIRKRGRSVWLEPDDLRMRGPMPVRGQVPRDARGDTAVVAEITQYPEYADEVPEVRVAEMLGTHGELEVEAQKIYIREGVVDEFGAEAREEANALPPEIRDHEREGREDLRDYDLVTIDPEDARDHDDAVWGKRTSDGGFRIIVAIADVAHYVTEGSALDREAFVRGCSIYLPDRAIPMLPARLSGDLASLKAGKDRLCLAVEMDLRPNGAVRGHRLIEGVMRSRGALTYPGVARALGLTQAAPAQREADAQKDVLQTLLAAARILRRRRQRRGALDFDLPEAKIILDEQGQEPTDVVRQRKDPGIREAYRLIEEMMLLANEVVARDFASRGVPTIYRVHGQPDEDKVEIFAQLASALGYPITPDDAMNPRKLSRFLRRIEGTPHAPVLSYLLLRAMQQATYDTTNIGHFGLASKEYLHFTSPIRRYPDLVVHRITRKVIRGRRMDPAKVRPELRRAAAESSRLERRAMLVERDVVDLYRTALMRDRVGDELDATVSHIAEQGLYVTFDSPFVEGTTSLERLDEDFFELDPLGIRLVGQNSGATYALGDRLRVRIEDVRLSEREVVVQPIARLEADEVKPIRAGDTKRRRKRGKSGEQRPRQRAGSRTKGREDGRKRGGGERQKDRPDTRNKGARDKDKKADRRATERGRRTEEKPDRHKGNRPPEGDKAPRGKRKRGGRRNRG